eukprot:387570_1
MNINKKKKKIIIMRGTMMMKNGEGRIQKMHKFHMFLLSNTYHFARPPGYNKKCWLLLDCNHQKIQKIEIKLQAALQCKKINIYTCDEYKQEEEKDNNNDNDDEKWGNFELIGSEMVVDDVNAAQGGMAQMMQMVAMAQLGQNNQLRGIDNFNKIELNGENKRFIKIEFEDFIMQQFVGIERLKIYIEKKTDINNELYDEDFQLKIIEESTKFNSVSGAINIYKKDSDYFWRRNTEINGINDLGYIIFDTNGKKINKIEFKVEKGYPFDIFNVYQSDQIDNKNNWKQIYTQTGNINENNINIIKFAVFSKKKIY